MRRNHRQNRRVRGLRLEQLETRRLLAGNVSVSRSGNTLFVRGDNAANEIGIFSAGGDDFTVVGTDTTINGSDDLDGQTFSGIRNLNVDLRGGDDVVGIADDPTGLFDIPGAVEGGFPIDLTTIGTTEQTALDGFVIIRTGAGADTVALSVNTGGFVDIATGGGNDDVAVLASDIGAHLFIRGEDGSDAVAVLDSFVETTTILEGGRGVDGIFVQTFDGSSMTVNGGRDNDDIGLFDMALDGSLVVLGEQGSDDINVEFSEARFVLINGGDGNDFIDADGLEVFGDLIVLGLGGSDDIEVEPNDEYIDEGVEVTSVGGALVIDGGSGNDSLEAELVEARFITIIGAGGNDDLNADGVLVENHLILLGGSGSNFIDVGLSDDDEFDPGIGSQIGTFLQVIGGNGADEVEVSDVDVNDFVLILLLGGDDVLTYTAVSAGGDETLDGGSGFDSLLIDFRNGRRIRNFENVDLFEDEEFPNT
jgi:hypothetical protein